MKKVEELVVIVGEDLRDAVASIEKKHKVVVNEISYISAGKRADVIVDISRSVIKIG